MVGKHLDWSVSTVRTVVSARVRSQVGNGSVLHCGLHNVARRGNYGRHLVRNTHGVGNMLDHR